MVSLFPASVIPWLHPFFPPGVFHLPSSGLSRSPWVFSGSPTLSVAVSLQLTLLPCGCACAMKCGYPRLSAHTLSDLSNFAAWLPLCILPPGCTRPLWLHQTSCLCLPSPVTWVPLPLLRLYPTPSHTLLKDLHCTLVLHFDTPQYILYFFDWFWSRLRLQIHVLVCSGYGRSLALLQSHTLVVTRKACALNISLRTRRKDY